MSAVLGQGCLNLRQGPSVTLLGVNPFGSSDDKDQTKEADVDRSTKDDECRKDALNLQPFAKG